VKDKLKLFLAFSPQPKQFVYDRYDKNDINTVLAPVHVNSGLTISMQSGHVCVVFREEEFEKVLLHELMHAYKFDTPDTKGNVECFKLVSEIQTVFKLHGTPLILNEGFNDTITCLCMIGFHEARRDPAMSLNEYLRAYESQFNKQQNYILDKAVQVLKYYGYSSYSDKQPIVQLTHVFSYYITKAVNFVFITQFNDLISNKVRLIDIEDGFCKYARLLNKLLHSHAFEMEVNRRLTKNKTYSNTLKMIDLPETKKLFKGNGV
jgi:hypothetical protein